MIGQFFSYVFGLNFMSGILITSVLFMLPLDKRRFWGLRLCVGFILCLLLGFGLQVFRVLSILPNRLLSGYVGSIIHTGVISLLFWRCCMISPINAVYGAFCAYAIEHFAAITCLLFQFLKSPHPPLTDITIINKLLIYLIIWIVCYFLIARKLPQNGQYQINIRYSISSAFILFGIATILYMHAMDAYYSAPSALIIDTLLYDMLCCVFFLWIQVSQRKQTELQAAVEVERLLLRQQADQYSLSRENINLIDQKCHDLKHQIAALRTMESKEARELLIGEIEQSVMIYNAVTKTGNEVLDTVLTEKCLYCEQNQIKWTCMADGSKLDFMAPVDLYTMFGNALDNAVEAVSQILETEKRIIAVTVESKYNAIFLQIENYFAHKINFRNGLPVSTKTADGFHGFGMKGIRNTVNKYGGTINLTTDDNIFILTIIIPVP